MTTSLDAPLRMPRAFEHLGAPVRRILVATSGQENTAGALRIARELGDRHDADVSAVTVYQPPVPLPLRAGEEPRLDPAARHELEMQRHTAARQLADVAEPDEWPLHVRVGEHGRCILEEAARQHADIILLGIGRANAGERPLGDRALLRVAYGTDRPVIAVSPTLGHLPRTVVLAVGENGETVRTARIVGAVSQPGATVHLVHVRELGETDEHRAARDRILAHVEDELRRAGLQTVRQEIPRGDPMRRVLAYARRAGADLIAGGLHGEGFAARAVVRNLALHIAAISRCSVLLVPRTEP